MAIADTSTPDTVVYPNAFRHSLADEALALIARIMNDLSDSANCILWQLVNTRREIVSADALRHEIDIIGATVVFAAQELRAIAWTSEARERGQAISGRMIGEALGFLSQPGRNRLPSRRQFERMHPAVRELTFNLLAQENWDDLALVMAHGDAVPPADARAARYNISRRFRRLNGHAEEFGIKPRIRARGVAA